MPLLALTLAGATLVADSPQHALSRRSVERPNGHRQARLYSLIYNERGKLGTSRSGLREGLNIVTPSRAATSNSTAGRAATR